MRNNPSNSETLDGCHIIYLKTAGKTAFNHIMRYMVPRLRELREHKQVAIINIICRLYKVANLYWHLIRDITSRG